MNSAYVMSVLACLTSNGRTVPSMPARSRCCRRSGTPGQDRSNISTTLAMVGYTASKSNVYLACGRRRRPMLLEATGNCTLEDVGGPWGYQEFCEALADPAHERHAEALESWGSSDHDPANANFSRPTKPSRTWLQNGRVKRTEKPECLSVSGSKQARSVYRVNS